MITFAEDFLPEVFLFMFFLMELLNGISLVIIFFLIKFLANVFPFNGARFSLVISLGIRNPELRFTRFDVSIEISNRLIYSFCKTVTVWETKSSNWRICEGCCGL